MPKPRPRQAIAASNPEPAEPSELSRTIDGVASGTESSDSEDVTGGNAPPEQVSRDSEVTSDKASTQEDCGGPMSRYQEPAEAALPENVTMNSGAQFGRKTGVRRNLGGVD